MTTKHKTYIIAEAGVNHNGDIEMAKRLIDVAAEAGADAVKFQTFSAEQLVSKDAPKAAYQKENTDKDQTQFEMIKKLELDQKAHEVLINHANSRGIDFLSTPFDLVSLELLTQKFDITTIKIPSGEITNAPFVLAVARAAQKVILSTGMSTLGEVETALSIIAFGFTASPSEMPGTNDLEKCYSLETAQQQLRDRVTILHCTTEYPAPVNEVNLSVMHTMANAFGLPTGYSDHTAGIHISLAAVALGATIIEKHYTLDRNLPGPDHKASLEPDELRQMIMNIREIERALGDGIKRPTASEWKNRDVARRSLVAKRFMKAGDTFTTDNITCKRPGTGMSPAAYWSMLGKKASKDYIPDEPIHE